MRSFVLLSCLALMNSVAAPAAGDDYYDLGDFDRNVTASSPEAAQWFVRGLVQCFGFNHEEAVRCFEQALRIDSGMAMAHWGIAYALGPNYNNMEVEEAAAERAHASAAEARALAGGASAVERALIHAVSARAPWPVPEERAELEAAYAGAMRKVHAEHPDDPEVAALFAESLMLLAPWALWSADGEPAEVTPEIRTVLEAGLGRWPDHPALCHLYVHAMEPSPEPALALPAANRLRDRVPDAGHLVHMPSHIDVLVGDYKSVIEGNQRAVRADRKFVEREGKLNFYTLYRLHNLHFLIYGAMFDGQKKLALDTARELEGEIPAELLADIPDFIEAFVPTRFHVQVRYGLWDEILREPKPPVEQPYTRSVWRYARALAFAAQGRVAEAEAEHAELVRAAGEVPETRVLFNNSCAALLEIAMTMSRAEIAYRKGRFDVAFDRLRHAVDLDDALTYDEPWGWMQPVRHALGALLLEQGRLDEAEEVYREDLRRHPKNGWALRGLAEALERRGAAEEAAACQKQLAAAWVRADVPATTSCYCRTGAVPVR